MFQVLEMIKCKTPENSYLTQLQVQTSISMCLPSLALLSQKLKMQYEQ